MKNKNMTYYRHQRPLQNKLEQYHPRQTISELDIQIEALTHTVKTTKQHSVAVVYSSAALWYDEQADE